MGKNRKPKVITSKTFEKPRAKVGKKLKSHTETDTNFKAKKLILLTQLQKSSTGAEPVSRRKLSLAVGLVCVRNDFDKILVIVQK